MEIAGAKTFKEFCTQCRFFKHDSAFCKIGNESLIFFMFIYIKKLKIKIQGSK